MIKTLRRSRGRDGKSEPPSETTRDQKITLDASVGLLLGYRCACSVEISGERWPDEIRLSNLEPLFVFRARLVTARGCRSFNLRTAAGKLI